MRVKAVATAHLEVPFWSIFQRDKRTGFPEGELLSVYRDYGVIRKSDRDDNWNRAGSDLSAYQLVEPGDLVVNKMKAWQGSLGVSKYRGIVSPAYFVYRQQRHDVDLDFLHHVLRSQHFINQYAVISKGVRPGQWDLQPEKLDELMVPLPPLPTQRAIADHLDRETAEIDAMAAELDELVEVLLERKARAPRTAFDAVAHGTTLNVVAEITLGKMLDEKKNTGAPRPYLRAANVTKDRVLDLSDMKVMRMSDGELEKFSIKAGDTIMIEGGDAGRVAFVKEDVVGVAFQKTVMRIRPDEKLVAPRYLFLALDWAYQSGRIALEHSVSTIPHFTAEKAARLPVPVPPLDEQQKIIAHLDEVTAEIDSMISDAQELKALLAERRSALITEVVTGRKEVPVP